MPLEGLEKGEAVKFGKGQREAAIEAIVLLLKMYDRGRLQEERQNNRKRIKGVKQQARRGSLRQQFKLVQDFYVAVLSIQKYANGKTDDENDNLELCAAIGRIVRAAFQRVYGRDGLRSRRQRLHKYSAILKWAWTSDIDKEDLASTIFDKGGIEKAMLVWQQVKPDA